jgi:hypothetical protein
MKTKTGYPSIMLPLVISCKIQHVQEYFMLVVVSTKQIYVAIFSRHFHTNMMIHPLTDVIMLLGKIILIEKH